MSAPEPEAPVGGADTSEEPERNYRPRPALWESNQPAESPSWSLRVAWAALLFVVIGGTIVMLLGGERLVASPPRMTRVEVIATLGTWQHDGPLLSRYRVRLLDGREALYTSPVVHAVGDHVDALVSEGWLTKRLYVEPPSRNALGQASSPPAGEQ